MSENLRAEPGSARASQNAGETFLVLGLGNPGREYRHNRHNVGFMVLDRLAERLDTRFTRLQFNALVTDARYQGHRLILAKPQTYMNLSGAAAAPLIRFYKIPLANALVTYDELDLPFGSLRLRPAGGSGGQKGMRSMIERLGADDFPRLRLGIGRPPGRMEPSAYLLQDFSPDETEMLQAILDQAADAVLAFVSEGIDIAMTRFNRGL
jgi:PTH1 family peptidyl-tRNA hydrolase